MSEKMPNKEKLVQIINGRTATVLSPGDSLLDANIEEDGTICIRLITDNRVRENIGEVIYRETRDLPLRLVRDDNSANVAWYEVSV